MPALSKTFTFNVGTDSNKNAIKSTSITYPPAGFSPTKVVPGSPVTYHSYPEKANGYYKGAGVHTVTYIPSREHVNASDFQTRNNFRGTVNIQATLASEPTESDWFDVPDTTTTFTELNYNNVFHNFNANYVWIRAKVVVTHGVLQAIHVNY